MVWTTHEDVRWQYEGKENLRALFISHQDMDQPTSTFLCGSHSFSLSFSVKQWLKIFYDWLSLFNRYTLALYSRKLIFELWSESFHCFVSPSCLMLGYYLHTEIDQVFPHSS
jgi:hypothetical protein